jgi:prepilin-type N-terminal cleavage/methylation domain-containing protein
MNPSRTKQRNGFTLIELLASIAILVLLTTIVFAIFNQASRAWLLGEARTETFAAARLAMEMIATELEGAIVTNNTQTGKQITYLDFDKSGGAFATGDSRLAKTPPNDAIFFVSNAPDSARKDYIDLTEYGYFVVFANDDAWTMKKGHYYLLRHAIDSTRGGWDIFTNPNSPLSASGWWSTPSVSDSFKTPILDNVVRFWVRYEDGGGPPPYGTIVRDDWPYLDRLPRAIHIRMSVLDRRYAARLSAIRPNGLTQAELSLVPYNESGQTIENLSDQALKNILRDGLRTFFRTVYPRNAS